MEYIIKHGQEQSFIRYWTKQSTLYADKVFVRYAASDQKNLGTYRNLSYEKVDRISTNLACKLSQSLQGVKSVGVIGDNSIFYLLTILAIMKLDILFVALSPRNPPSAVAKILKQSDTDFIFTWQKYTDLAENASKEIGNCRIFTIEPADIDILSDQNVNPLANKIIPLPCKSDSEKAVMAIHSSGTTGFPKLNFLSNRYLINMSLFFKARLANTHPDIPYNSSSVFLSSTPLFHLFGLISVFSNISTGGSAVFMKSLHPSMKEIMFALKHNKCTIAAFPPLIIEHLLDFCKQEGDFSPLQELDLALYGGAPLSQETGNFFKTEGIHPCSIYGSTEIGPFLSSSMNPSVNEWSTLVVHSTTENYCIWEPYQDEPGLYHLIVREGSPYSANNISNRIDGHYSTNDIFKETEPNSGRYIYYGRMDDTLIMENGEKTNALTMEATIRQCPIISQCIIFGQGRQCTGVLIELSSDECQKYASEEIVDLVYSAVQKANINAPSHSTILSQMIKILPLNMGLPTTDKKTVSRKKANEQYKDMIEKLYDDFLKPLSSLSRPSKKVPEWSLEETTTFLVESAASILGISPEKLKDTNQSLFDLGLNSLLSIQLVNQISQTFGTVNQDFLFQYPTINQIQEALSLENVSGTTLNNKSLKETELILENYLNQASNDFEVTNHAYTKGQPQVVLLTGVTGSLGSFILSDLIKTPLVSKIYCLVRGKGPELLDRIYHAFESRSLDISLLSSQKIVVLPMSLDDDNLGFSQDLYTKLKSEVTIIQHCAWLLNFNYPVKHYDKECIQSLYNLVKFAYRRTNPIHFHFISSISASAGWGEIIPESPLPRNPKVAMPMGYAQSKYIVEHLFNYLAKEKNFPCIIERLGQVCGDSVNGTWNTTEQYPLMFIGGGKIMKKMPSINSTVDWIPLDYASSCIVDIMLKTSATTLSPEDSVYNIVNPQRAMWNDVLKAMRVCGMEFHTVGTKEWVDHLQRDVGNPASRLLSFYKNNLDNSETRIWSTSKTCCLCPLLEETPVFDANLLGKYISYWKSVGFYKDKYP
ncbi:hypothetical protein CLU79DRAFT_694195 [Phycomyces nitens]|nr:hypothetical protein CLU79DRAFT_694195 [Phycomyces nitens]